MKRLQDLAVEADGLAPADGTAGSPATISSREMIAKRYPACTERILACRWGPCCTWRATRSLGEQDAETHALGDQRGRKTGVARIDSRAGAPRHFHRPDPTIAKAATLSPREPVASRSR